MSLDNSLRGLDGTSQFKWLKCGNGGINGDIFGSTNYAPSLPVYPGLLEISPLNYIPHVFPMAGVKNQLGGQPGCGLVGINFRFISNPN